MNLDQSPGAEPVQRSSSSPGPAVMDPDQNGPPHHELVSHRGFNLIRGIHDPHDVDLISQLELRDSDVFAVTYPKSGEASGHGHAQIPAPALFGSTLKHEGKSKDFMD